VLVSELGGKIWQLEVVGLISRVGGWTVASQVFEAEWLMTDRDWKWQIQEWLCRLVAVGSGLVSRFTGDQLGVPCDTFMGGVGWVVASFLAGILVLVMVLTGDGVWWWQRHCVHAVKDGDGLGL